MWVKTPFVLGLASLLVTAARATPPSSALARSNEAPHQLHKGIAPQEQGASQDDFAHQPPGGGATYRRRAEGQPDARSLYFNRRADAKSAKAIDHDGKAKEQEQPSKDDFAHQPPGGGATYRRGLIDNLQSNLPTDRLNQAYVDKAAQEEEKKGRPAHPGRDNWSHMPPGGGATY